MSQNLPVNGFKWAEDTSEFHESFIRSCNEEVKKNTFSKLIFNIQKIYLKDFLFLHGWMKIEKVEKAVADLQDKLYLHKNLCRTYLRNLRQALDHGLVLKKRT